MKHIVTSETLRGLAPALKLLPWVWIADEGYTFGLEQEMWEPGVWTCRLDQPGDDGDTILSSASKPAYAVRAVAAKASKLAEERD